MFLLRLIFLLSMLFFFNNAISQEITKFPSLKIFGIVLNAELDKKNNDFKIIDRSKKNDDYEQITYQLVTPKKETDNLTNLFDEYILNVIKSRSNNTEIVVGIDAKSDTCNNSFELKRRIDDIDLTRNDFNILPGPQTAELSFYSMYNKDDKQIFFFEIGCNRSGDRFTYLYVSVNERFIRQ